MTDRRATDRRSTVADGIATALLAGAWEQQPMAARVAAALERRPAPKWIASLVGQVLDGYRDPTADRPRELAAYLQTRPAWALAWQHRRAPRIVHLAPAATVMVRQPWPTIRLDEVRALTRLLDVDTGELEWFADVRSLERRVAEPLRHYRWRTLPKRGGVRLVAAPKPRLKEIQRRLLRHLLDPIPLHDAAHGCVLGRSVIRVGLESFFSSFSAAQVWGLLRTAGLPEAVAHVVTGL